MSQSCAEYWESQGVDPLDAALTVGCLVGENAAPSPTGHDVIGGLIFVLLLAAIALTTFKGKPVDDEHDVFR